MALGALVQQAWPLVVAEVLVLVQEQPLPAAGADQLHGYYEPTPHPLTEAIWALLWPDDAGF